MFFFLRIVCIGVAFYELIIYMQAFFWIKMINYLKYAKCLFFLMRPSTNSWGIDEDRHPFNGKHVVHEASGGCD